MTKPWADKPYALLPIPGQPGGRTSTNPGVLYMAWDMANVHNLLIRGLNAIYQQAPHIHDPTDISDFTFYMKAWADAVHHHHRSEETTLFPRFDEVAKEAGMEDSGMNANIEQHHEFEPGFNSLSEYVDGVREGKVSYDGMEVRKMVEGFADVFTQHLHDEVDTLLRLEKLDGEKLKKIFESVAKESAGTVDVYQVLPLFFGCIDKTSPGAQGFPAVPFFLQWFSALWFCRKHKGSWRFNPCDQWSRPRALQFLGEEEK